LSRRGHAPGAIVREPKVFHQGRVGKIVAKSPASP
jgi:hypothetical protein